MVLGVSAYWVGDRFEAFQRDAEKFKTLSPKLLDSVCDKELYRSRGLMDLSSWDGEFPIGNEGRY